MPVSDSTVAFVLDQLAGLGDVSARRMFGAVGLYCGDLFFGILADDQLYLKVDERNRGRHERAGMAAFRPYPDRAETMRYYGVPAGVLESAPELVVWAREAVAVAHRARSGRSSRRKAATTARARATSRTGRRAR